MAKVLLEEKKLYLTHLYGVRRTKLIIPLLSFINLRCNIRYILINRLEHDRVCRSFLYYGKLKLLQFILKS